MAFLMMRTALSLFKLALPILSAIWMATPAQAGDDLAYHRRGNHHEGRKSFDVSGIGGLVLVAAQAKVSSPVDGPSPQLHARFYLPKPQPVSIVVREREPASFYWLDKVEPKKIWPQGFGNDFAWDTAPVLEKLSLHLSNLVAIARLNGDKPSDEETVAPVVLYAAQAPKCIEGYVFRFHLRDAAHLRWQLIKEENNKKIAQGERNEPDGAFFDVYWRALDQTAGDYRLILSGRLNQYDRTEIPQQTVHFHHQPLVN